MGDKTIKTRIQLKYDTEENWKKSVLEADGGTKTTTGSSFIPKKGEVILYSTDGTHPFSRLKVGDGITNVVQLPFLGIRFQDIGDKDNIKTKQTAVTDPNVVGGATSNSFINTISQDTNGEITVTKANISSASTSGAGIVQLNDATNSTDTDKAATPNAVKNAYDLANTANSAANAASIIANNAIPKSAGTTTGDILYYDSGNNTTSYSRLGIGSQGYFLKVSSSGLPNWEALSLLETDIPALSASKINSGTFDLARLPEIPLNGNNKKVTGILQVTNGGTGLGGTDNFYDNGVFAYDANNVKFKQISINSANNYAALINDFADNTAQNQLVTIATLKLAIPPMNQVNPISTAGNGYQLSYYAPTSKGTLHSVLIAQGTSTNSQGTEPLWLDPTSLSGVDNTGSGGTLFYGRDSLSNESVKPFKTQWGTLPVEQGGTGCTTFAIGQLLVGNGTGNLTTIVKTYENIANTVVVRDSSGDFCTRQITLHSGGYGLISDYNNENLSSAVINERKKIIIIDNNGIPTHYGNLEANNLTATIGIINMSCTNAYSDSEAPMINWYKKITIQGNSTEYKIGEINWDITNNTGILKNYYYNNNNVYYEAYKLPNLPVDLSTNKTYTLLSTNDSQLLTQFLENSVLYTAGGFNKVTSIRSNNGALYASSQGGNLQWGTLPVAQGGTGLTTTTTINAVVIGNSINATHAMQTVATADGAFYATTTNGVPQFGTLPVGQGGTGQTTIANIEAGKDGNGDTISSTYVKVDGTNAMIAPLDLTPATSNGGQINLNASTENTTQAGISLEQYNSTLYIFGIPSSDNITKIGIGTALVIDPYAKTITGNYNYDGNAATATAIQTAGTTAQFYRGDNTWSNVLTGDLITTNINLKNSTTDVTAENNGADSTIYHSIWGLDKNGKSWFCVEGYTNTNGSVAAFLGVRNYATNGTAQSWKGITITEAKDNVLTYTVSDANKFRSAISTWALISDRYNTFMPADGITNGWYKFGTSNTSYGILPSASGDAGSGHNYIGTSSWYWKYSYIDEMYARNLTISGANNGIYFNGSKANNRMIRFIDNTADVYGNGISIGGGGYTIIGSGESADTMVNNLGYTGGSEITVVASDGDIAFYPGNNSYDASAKLTMTASRFWAGVNGNTTREAQIGVQSGAGQIYLWSAASTTGDRGIWTPAHGTGGAKYVISVNTNNVAFFQGGLTGPGVSGSTHAEALKAYFNSYKASEPRNALVAHYSSAHSNGSLCMGYFLNGYDSGPYGGFFVCHYNWPRYVGINNGTYTQHDLISNQNYTSYTVTKTGSGASGTWGISVTGNAANVTGTVAVGHGGTGATNATDARGNLGAVYQAYINQSTFANVYNNYLKNMQFGGAALFEMTNATINALNGGKGWTGGDWCAIVWKAGSTPTEWYHIFAFNEHMDNMRTIRFSCVGTTQSNLILKSENFG